MSRRRVVIGAATCALTITALWAAVAPAAVNYPDFSSVDGLKLNEDAFQSGDRVRLTTSANDQVGSAWTKKRVVSPTKNFKTHFQISQHDGTPTPGDGMTFVVQSVSNDVVGGGAGGLGYQDIGHSLAVKFDIFDNGPDDPSGNFIGLTKNGRAGGDFEAEDPGFALYPNEPYVWVEYKAKSNTVKVWANTIDEKPAEGPLFTHKIKLKDVLDGGKGFAGFTGATGGANAQQDVLNWTLKSG